MSENLKSDGLHCPDGTIIPKAKTTHIKSSLTKEQKIQSHKYLQCMIKDFPDACPEMLKLACDTYVTEEGKKLIEDYYEKNILED